MTAESEGRVRLTKAQREWLEDAVSSSGVGFGSVTNRTAEALQRMQLARRHYDARGLGTWLITPAGRRALETSHDK